jgi:hypothetical protein
MQELRPLSIPEHSGETQTYVRRQKVAEELQQFDKTQMLAFLPPKITAETPAARYELYHCRRTARG